MSTTTPATLPTREELDAAWTALADAEEDIGAAANHVVRVANGAYGAGRFDEATRATYWADIGALLAFVHESRRVMSFINASLTKIQRATLEDLAAVAKGGELAHVPQYPAPGVRLERIQRERQAEA